MYIYVTGVYTLWDLIKILSCIYVYHRAWHAVWINGRTNRRMFSCDIVQCICTLYKHSSKVQIVHYLLCCETANSILVCSHAGKFQEPDATHHDCHITYKLSKFTDNFPLAKSYSFCCLLRSPDTDRSLNEPQPTMLIVTILQKFKLKTWPN